MTKKEKQKNARLLRTYGITLQEWTELMQDQHWSCWICGKKPADGQLSLSVDHDHSWKKVKVKTAKSQDGWHASAEYRGCDFNAVADKKSDAISEVKKKLLRASCRGALCVWCNRGLRYYHDNPELLRKAAKYLERLEPRYD